MIKLVSTEIVAAVQGHCTLKPSPGSAGGVAIDSRAVSAGDVFFAIRGPNHDGHAYVSDALSAGALLAIIQSGRRDDVLSGIPADRAARAAAALVEVDDPVAALGRLAAFHRRQVAADVIAVVGSNGKTTVKGMIDHILSGRMRGRAAPKSYNNAIGVPLTLLSAETSDEYTVVEIGTNAPGEVRALGRIAEPDMAVITSIAEEHLEGLHDLKGVAAEEASVLSTLRRGGFAAVNVDSDVIAEHIPTDGPTIVSFGRDSEADLHVSDARYDAPWTYFELNHRFAYRIAGPGAHNAVNAAGAIAVARRFGMEHDEIAARLEGYSLPAMRGEIVQVGALTIVNDAYNANPASVIAGLGVLDAVADGGRRVGVFGEMRELGARSAELHERVAAGIADRRLDLVVLVGAAARLMGPTLRRSQGRAEQVELCENVEQAADLLAEALRPGDVVLLKASRTVGLERLIEPLRREFSAMTHS